MGQGRAGAEGRGEDVGRYTDNQQAQDAINLTFFHWGIHGWIVYVLVGLLLGVIAYRNNLPMTMRTCFYPLLGDKVFGRLGSHPSSSLPPPFAVQW